MIAGNVSQLLRLGLLLCLYHGADSTTGQAYVISVTIRPGNDPNSNESHGNTELKNNSTTTTAAALPISSSARFHGGDDCSMISLAMTTPQAVKFQLVCDDSTEPIWDYPTATTEDSSSSSFGILSLTECIPHDACCEFSIQNDPQRVHQDEETDSSSSSRSSIQVEHDGLSIFNLKLEANKPFPFDSFSRIFGYTCTAKQEDNEESTHAQKEDTDPPSSAAPHQECIPDEETPVHLSITLDDKPEQQSWYLICTKENNEIVKVWDVPQGSLTQPRRTLEQKACIDSTDSCVFFMVDSEGDGLETGGYRLAFGDELIGSHMSKEEFQRMAYCVGHSCESDTWNGILLDDSQAFQEGDGVTGTDSAPYLTVAVCFVVGFLISVFFIHYYGFCRRSSAVENSLDIPTEISGKQEGKLAGDEDYQTEEIIHHEFDI